MKKLIALLPLLLLGACAHAGASDGAWAYYNPYYDRDGGGYARPFIPPADDASGWYPPPGYYPPPDYYPDPGYGDPRHGGPPYGHAPDYYGTWYEGPGYAPY